MQLKIVLVGERRVGKTSLLERYLKNHFTEEYTGTLGGRVYTTDLEIGLEGEDIALAHIAFFDLMGEHSVRKVFAEPFFFGTQGVLAVCDVERPDTLHLIKDWMDVMTKIAGPVPVGIAFNKIDRADSMAIGPGETAWLRKEFPTAPMFHDERADLAGGRGRVLDDRLACRRRGPGEGTPEPEWSVVPPADP